MNMYDLYEESYNRLKEKRKHMTTWRKTSLAIFKRNFSFH